MSCQGTVSPKGARKLHDADVVYLYDGSFEGFLCCVYESFAQHELPFAVWTPQRETATLYPVKEIATDPAVARRVFASFGKKLGAETEYLVSRDFLSGQEDKELLLLRFLHLAFALGPGTVKREGHPVVAPLYAMKKSLDWEVDKFQGFVRFEEHDGMLGAVIHPKNYILPLLRPHFCGRFPEEDFMIYDAVHQAVLLLISNSGKSRRLNQMAQTARDNGVPVVLITCDRSSPLAQLADHLLISTNREQLITTTDFALSRISAIVIIEVLYNFLLVGRPGAKGFVSRHEGLMAHDKDVR